MEYKYENVESVEVKETFKAHKHDDGYEITETIEIPVGAKGVIASMGCSSIDNFENHYDVELRIDQKEIEVCVSEKNMEKFFELRY
ncbi:hypothetical protein IHV10_22160 [Fictibacillus sp. 5RED26]|uniref:hypothetical protein n=1 Tax=Fictibacillus sp. 5RED26 TaxID=2745876 RepID=UPI0018CD10A0|nr:hypothetical protein [Fictibacillus sp. 5RED26]MBH0159077.1 hypothetical protein [Fictibacillus sp. 5RED26]